MYLNLEQEKQCVQNNQENENSIESVEQYLPDEINESNSQQNLQYKQPQPSIVIPIIGGFLTDDAIDFKDNLFIKNKTKRITIFSQFSYIYENTSNFNVLNISRFFAWGILIYQTLNNAIIAPWIMTINFDKYLRIVWRFFIQTLFQIPLIMYEKRNLNLDKKEQYYLTHIFKRTNLQKLYLASLIPSISQSIFLFCFEYTFISTVFLLGQQTNFWLSLLRSKQQNHKIEKIGQIIWFLGLICIIFNLSNIEVQTTQQNNINFINTFIYNKPPLLRILIGTTLPVIIYYISKLISSFLSAKFSYLNIQIREIFPMHIINFIISLFTCLNVLIAGFFIDGIQFDQDHFFGIFGLFYQSRIIMFTYITIIIMIGIWLCSILTSQLFDQFTLVIFNMMEPILTSIFLRFTGVQDYPEILQYFGYSFVQFGQLIIIIGQNKIQSQNLSNLLEQYQN